MNNILISGITGFVGGNLKDSFQEKYKITGISRTRNSTKNIISYDNLDETVLNNSEVFIHLAGKAHDLKNNTSKQDYFAINTDLTIKLFDLFLESNCSVFIFMSTVKSATDKINGVLTEDIIPNPITDYGKSKFAAEQYILSKNIPETKKVYILRPCMIHGPNNKGNLNLLYKMVNKGLPFPLGSFKNKRSFLSVENLCFVIDELINKRPKSGVFNVADDGSISTNDLVKFIGKSINKKVTILKFPKIIIQSIAKIGNVINLPINSYRLEKLTENYVVSNKKIKEALDLNLPLSIEEGIGVTMQSFNNK